MEGETTELFNLVLSQSQVEALREFAVAFPKEELNRSEVARTALKIGLDEMRRRCAAVPNATWDAVTTCR